MTSRWRSAVVWALVVCGLGCARAGNLAGTGFTEPSSLWQSGLASPDKVSFSSTNPKHTQAAVMGLYAARQALGEPLDEFEAEWRDVVLALGQVTPLAPPQRRPGMMVREAVVLVPGDGRRYAMLAVVQGRQRVVSVMLIVNPPEAAHNYMADFSRFLGSVKPAGGNGQATPQDLPLPSAAAPGADPAATASAIPVVGSGPHRPTSLVGDWDRQLGALRTYGANSNFGATYNLGSARAQYHFQADGRYTFQFHGWGGYSNNVHTLITETGHWQLSGSQLTLRGEQSQGEDHQQRVDGPVLRRFSGRAATNTYAVTWFYNPISDDWQLVLTTPTETERDGEYSAMSKFPHSYMYSPLHP